MSRLISRQIIDQRQNVGTVFLAELARGQISSVDVLDGHAVVAVQKALDTPRVRLERPTYPINVRLLKCCDFILKRFKRAFIHQPSKMRQVGHKDFGSVPRRRDREPINVQGYIGDRDNLLCKPRGCRSNPLSPPQLMISKLARRPFRMVHLFCEIKNTWHASSDGGPACEGRHPFSEAVLLCSRCAKWLSTKEEARGCDQNESCRDQPNPAVPVFAKVHLFHSRQVLICRLIRYRLSLQGGVV